MKKNDFKIGDRVKIDWPGNKLHEKIGTIVKDYDKELWTIKIPDFDGHFGEIPDGTKDKWNVHFSYLTKIEEPKTEGNSMKIELKKTEKKVKEIAYPCFRKNEDGLVVFFFSVGTGVVVEQGKTPWDSGHFSSSWATSCFGAPLEGHSVTFSSVP